jgi:hypothetical protein
MATKSARNLAARYLDLLAEEGYRPGLDGADDRHAVISFKSEGETFLLFVDEDDDNFFHLGSWFEVGDLELATAVDRANELNEQLRVVKTTIGLEDRVVRFQVESFLDDPPASLELIERAVIAARSAASLFFEPARTVEHLDA